MIIIIDWPDLSWKTTLLKKLKKIFWKINNIHFPLVVVPRISFEKDKNLAEQKVKDFIAWAKTEVDIAKQLTKNWQHIILDRCYMSELVYWKIFRKYDPYKYWDEYKLIEEQLNKYWEYIYIYLYDDFEWYKKRFEEKWDDYVDKADYFKELINLYDNFYEKTTLKNKIKINPFKDKEHINKIINKIIEIQKIDNINNDERKKQI